MAVLRQVLLLSTILLLQQWAHAQEEMAYRPAQAIAAWQQKIYVHVNKTFFVSGEPVWFSIFNTDALHHHPTGLEKLAFIELFNSRQEPVLQATVPLQNGRGQGSWIIPDTLQTGNYLLRAYTNAMRNEGQNAYFEIFIAIVNTSRHPLWNELEKRASIDVQVFPEGGNLVYGLANNTAIRCVNEYGEGIAASGAVINQHHDTVARFVTCCGGRALFNWTPKREAQYNVVVQPKDQPKRVVPVPQPAPDGVAMAVKESGSGKLEVAIEGSVHFQNQSLLLVAGNAHLIQLQNRNGFVMLSEHDLPQGFSNLLLYDAAGKLLANRQWYRKPTDSLAIAVQLAQSVFTTRQKVIVDLSTTSSGQATAADLSISVFRVDSLQGIGHIDAEKYLGGTAAAELMASPDLFVRTAGKAWNYNHAHNTNDASPFYLPQYEGPQVAALVTNKQSAKPAAGITAYLSAPGKHYQFLSAVSDTAGIVRFNLKNLKDQQKLWVTLDPKQNDFAVQLCPFFDPLPPAGIWPRFYLPEKRAARLQEHSLSQQIQAAFKLLPHLSREAAPSDTSSFFGPPDKTYLLDDYTRFPTLEEVLREYVPEVLVRKRDNAFHYKVFNAPYGQFFDEDPLVLVDGVPVFDIDKIMSADPLKIKKLEVITRRYASGLQVYRGIMSFSTYAGNLDGMPLPPQAQLSNIKGSLEEQEFRHVQHKELTAADNRIPDQRLQLCWLPALQPGANGKQNFSFFTSDATGTYAIVVQGISKTGTAGSAILFFEVKH